MDDGKQDPSLGWRFTDAWLSMAGNGDKGTPNGLPVDEWGIRVNENSQPVGSCVARGGDTNGPAAVYAVEKYVDWLKNYAPPAAAGLVFSEPGPVPAQGAIAQPIFWYPAFPAAMVKEGLPVVNENSQPVGSCVARGGDTNGPAAVYAVEKYVDWLKNYAPPAAAGMVFSEAGPVPAQGEIAQQIFWYTAFTADMVKEGLPVVNEDGTPKWRMAPSPHGAYWEEGQKLGYQDAGSWTLMKSTPVDRAKAAWLYAQFVTSKTVDVKKSHVGLTFIRESTVQHESFTERAPNLGGLIEFYRSPARVQWSPTGTNVPDYRSEEHTSELQSLMRISYAVFCLKKQNTTKTSTAVVINH